MFSCILIIPLTKGLFVDNMIIFVLRLILMLNIKGTKEIKN